MCTGCTTNWTTRVIKNNFEIKGTNIQLPISDYNWKTKHLQNNGAKFPVGKYDRIKLRTPEPCRSSYIVAWQNKKSRSTVLKLCFSNPEISIMYVWVLLKAVIFRVGNFHGDALYYIKVKITTHIFKIFQEM